MVDCITQEDENGCVIAAMASILEISYQEMKSKLYILAGSDVNIDKTGIIFEELSSIMSCMGVTVISYYNREAVFELVKHQEEADPFLLHRINNGFLFTKKTLEGILISAGIPAIVEIISIAKRSQDDLDGHALVYNPDNGFMWNPATGNYITTGLGYTWTSVSFVVATEKELTRLLSTVAKHVATEGHI